MALNLGRVPDANKDKTRTRENEGSYAGIPWLNEYLRNPLYLTRETVVEGFLRACQSTMSAWRFIVP